jgi:hypothetical protein
MRMGDLEDALESWDGTSEPPDVVKDYMKSLSPTDKPNNDKVAAYLGGNERNQLK